MHENESKSRRRKEMLVIGLAGLAGGAAEVAWMSLFAGIQHADGLAIAGQITASFIPGSAHAAWAAAAGLLIHFALSIVLAGAFATLAWKPLLRYAGRGGLIIGGLTALTVVWAINFFVLLPVINPAFVALVPLPAAFISKILFGVAMSLVLADPVSTRHFYAAETRSRQAVSV